MILDGRTETVDLGRIRGADGAVTWFGTVAATGFDSLVSDRVNRMRWPHGRMRYNLAIVAELSRLRLLPFRLVLDGEREIIADLTLAAFGNTRSYGGGMLICPNADHGDGLLDITMVHRLTNQVDPAVPRVPRRSRRRHHRSRPHRHVESSSTSPTSPPIGQAHRPGQQPPPWSESARHQRHPYADGDQIREAAWPACLPVEISSGRAACRPGWQIRVARFRDPQASRDRLTPRMKMSRTTSA